MLKELFPNKNNIRIFFAISEKNMPINIVLKYSPYMIA